MPEGSRSPAVPAPFAVGAMAVAPGGDDREVVFTRTLAATRALVWKAWTEPARLAAWWGPHGFQNPVCELDLGPGGALRIVMRGPDGADYPIVGTIHEVAPPSRLVFTLDTAEHPPEWQRQWNEHRGTPGGGPSLKVRVTVLFEEAGTSTRLTIRSHLDTARDCTAYVTMGSPAGWAQSLERLESLVSVA